MNDITIIDFVKTFMSGCAQFFLLPVPFFPDINIFQLFSGFLIIRLVLQGVYIIFGLTTLNKED